MYEALAAVAEAAGDSITENLAKEIQKEEKAAAEKIWKMIPFLVRLLCPLSK